MEFKRMGEAEARYWKSAYDEQQLRNEQQMRIERSVADYYRRAFAEALRDIELLKDEADKRCS